jgi:hypothetical protein
VLLPPQLWYVDRVRRSTEEDLSGRKEGKKGGRDERIKEIKIVSRSSHYGWKQQKKEESPIQVARKDEIQERFSLGKYCSEKM